MDEHRFLLAFDSRLRKIIVESSAGHAGWHFTRKLRIILAAFVFSRFLYLLLAYGDDNLKAMRFYFEFVATQFPCVAHNIIGHTPENFAIAAQNIRGIMRITFECHKLHWTKYSASTANNVRDNANSSGLMPPFLHYLCRRLRSLRISSPTWISNLMSMLPGFPVHPYLARACARAGPRIHNFVLPLLF